jgi:hypothetical protein
MLMNYTDFFLFDSNFDFKKFEKEIVFESSVLAWIRIRIEQKCWIRIRKKSIRIHNSGWKTVTLPASVKAEWILFRHPALLKNSEIRYAA